MIFIYDFTITVAESSIVVMLFDFQLLLKNLMKLLNLLNMNIE